MNSRVPGRLHLCKREKQKLRSAEVLDIDPHVDVLAALAGRLTTLAFESSERTTQLVIGERRLLDFLPEIQQLRARYGQQYDLTTDPEYFIAANTLKDRRVAAVLIRRDLALEACVLFFEHCKFGIGLGLIRGGDATGGSFVTGTEAFRVHYADLAAQALLRQWRILGVSLTASTSMAECIKVMGLPGRHRMFTERAPRHKLKLAPTYGEMLANMGPRTRRSLAAKRRQLEQKAGVLFLPELAPSQALEAMTQLRSRSSPVRIREFCQARYKLLCDRPELFSMALRLPDGTWLSVVSGWRRDRVTYIDLQMNDMHFKKESISAVMRAFLLEHEISLGQQLISFVGGCSVLLGRYCEPGDPCTDVVLCRPGLRSALLKFLIPWIKPESRYERLSHGADH